VTAPIRVLVVDDEALARKRVLGFLADEPDLVVVGEAGSGSAAVEAIADRRPDLVLLDVQMPGLDGFGVLRCVTRAHLPAVIFVTAHDEHAIQAFEVQAVDYLLKPVSAARFHQAVRRAVARIRSSPPAGHGGTIAALLDRIEPIARPAEPRIPIRVAGRTELVAPGEIDWIEAGDDRLEIHAGSTVHRARGTLAELEGRLPEDRFARIHRSLIVNRDRVRRIESLPKGDYVLVLENGARLRSGRIYREVVRRMKGG
jgi:two-component system LytT family response regulator